MQRGSWPNIERRFANPLLRFRRFCCHEPHNNSRGNRRPTSSFTFSPSLARYVFRAFPNCGHDVRQNFVGRAATVHEHQRRMDALSRHLEQLFKSDRLWLLKIAGACVVGLLVAIQVAWRSDFSRTETIVTLIVVPTLTMLGASVLVRADSIRRRLSGGESVGVISRLLFGAGIWSLHGQSSLSTSGKGRAYEFESCSPRVTSANTRRKSWPGPPWRPWA